MSNKFRFSRQSSELTQEAAAKKIGIHVTTLNKYEQGHREPSADVVRKMAVLYKCSLDELVGLPNGSNFEKEEAMYRTKYEEKCEEVIALQKRLLEQTPAKKVAPKKRVVGE